jgi:hypothetical protein
MYAWRQIVTYTFRDDEFLEIVAIHYAGGSKYADKNATQKVSLSLAKRSRR